MQDEIKARLLATVGGAERFEGSFNWRTFSPKRRAEQAVADGVVEALHGVAALGDAGPELVERWLVGYVARWAKYQHAGARTANAMVTGPARFPVERNRKRLDVEHRRSLELSEYANGAAAWARRQERIAAGREAIANDAGGHEEREAHGVRMIKNAALDRVQLVFPGKPEPAMIVELKGRAFRWAPSLGVWQRQLTANGIHAAECVMRKLDAVAAN